MASPIFARVSDALEPIVLRRAERVALGYSDAQAEAVRRRATAARNRLSAAQELRGSRSTAGAFALLREATIFAVAALVAARLGEGSAPSTPAAAHDALLSLVRSSKVPTIPDALLGVDEALASDNPLSSDLLDARELVRAKAYVAWLLGLVEARSVGQLRALRALRLGGLALSIVAAVALALAIALSAKDLAKGARVSASSVHRGFRAAEIVDGTSSAQVGYESNVEENPWVRLDLKDHFQLTSIVVYGGESARPRASGRLRLEISDDGATWQAVRQGLAPTGETPWRITLTRPWARYVRITLQGRGALRLREVEVYGQ